MVWQEDLVHPILAQGAGQNDYENVKNKQTDTKQERVLNSTHMRKGVRMIIWILLIISLIVATIIVNGVQRLYMKAMGADVMFFRGKTKLIAIVVIALVLEAIILWLFKIPIPGV